MLNKHINNATISEGTLLLAQPAASCASRTSRRRAGFHSPPSLPTTQFSNTLLTGGINHERTFPFWHDSHSRQDTHDGRHLARCLSAAAFAPQPSAAGDSFLPVPDFLGV